MFFGIKKKKKTENGTQNRKMFTYLVQTKSTMLIKINNNKDNAAAKPMKALFELDLILILFLVQDNAAAKPNKAEYIYHFQGE